MRSSSRYGYHLASLIFITFCLANSASALVLSKPQVPYYGKAFYDSIARGDRDQAMIDVIRESLTSLHVEKGGGALDEIVRQCPSKSKCTGQTSLSYHDARKKLFGQLHLVKTDGGRYAVLDVYCEKNFEMSGPDTIPDDKVVNCEHTWPQSRFSSGADKATQKTDLHHLFPTDSQMNSIRGNVRFGEVDRPDQALKCPIAKIGSVADSGGQFFEPPDHHKGNVARALFYFSIRYRIRIDAIEEKFLKKWNHDDPVDAFESTRNERIQQIQGNRNPFVDHPELADAISDF